MSTTNECTTVEIGLADRPTRFHVNPVGGGGTTAAAQPPHQNGTSIPTIETTAIAADPVPAAVRSSDNNGDGHGHEMLRLRHPASASLLDVEAANEVDSFPESGTGAKIIAARPQSR